MPVKSSNISLCATHTHTSSGFYQKTLPKLIRSSGQGGKAAPHFGDSQAPTAQMDSHSSTQMQPHSGHQHNPQHPPTMSLRTNVYVFSCWHHLHYNREKPAVNKHAATFCLESHKSVKRHLDLVK